MPDIKDLLNRESKLKQFHAQTLVPFFRSARRVQLTAHDKTTVMGFAFECPQPIASVVLVPGRTESTYKYSELIYDLHSMGVTVFSIDHRGQGESQRLAGDPHVGHVGHFNDYIDDLAMFVEQGVKPALKAPLFFLGHSMGGAILSLYLLNRPRPPLKGVIFSSPMFEINFGKFPPLIAATIARLTSAFGMTEQYVTGTGPVDVPTYGIDLSSSEVRVQLMRDMLTNYPAPAIGGPTNGWLKTAIDANREIAVHRGWKKWNHPTLLLDAESDQIVMRRGYEVLSQIDAPFYRLAVPHAQHEIFFECDAMRALGVRAVEHFIMDLCL